MKTARHHTPENFVPAALRCYAAIFAVRKAQEHTENEACRQALADARKSLHELGYLIGKMYAPRS